MLLFDIMAKYNPLTFETKYEQVEELKQKAKTLRPRGVYTGSHKILNRENLQRSCFRLHGTQGTVQIFERPTALESVAKFAQKFVLSQICLDPCKQ